MKDPTKVSILFLEDVAAEAQLVDHVLRQGGLRFRSKRVDTRAEFLDELEHRPPDVILSDHGLPAFNGKMALALAKEKLPDVPFIFLTGALGEQDLIEMFRGGATDCVLKHHLDRLVNTVRRVLREAEERSELKQKERALQQSQALKSAILETVLDAIVSLNHEGLVEEWNRAAQNLFGYTRAQALGRSICDLILSPEICDAYPIGFTHFLLTGGVFDAQPFELALRRSDGRQFPAELAISRVLENEAPHFTALIRDITARKRAEARLRESEERLRLILACASDYAIFLLDPIGNLTTWSVGAKYIEDFRDEEIIGQAFGVFFPPEDVQRGEPKRLLKQAEAEGRADYEGWRVRKNGTRFWIQGSLNALRDESGKLYGFCKIARDHTKQKEGEEQIRRLNELLEQRVRERTSQLEIANEELESFTYSVSHDLRAPLRHIAGYVGILQGQAGAITDPANRKYLEIIARSANDLGHLIDALLDFSRMGRAALARRPVSLAALVEEAQRELHRDIEGRDVDWQIGSLPAVQGDAFMLRQVFLNLISNALKYTRTRPRAKIEISAREANGEITVFIRDNGVGFDMKYADKLFGVFQRLHPASEFEGIGIGLANVRRIIHRHGGRTWAEGTLDGGAAFFFSLPKPGGQL